MSKLFKNTSRLPDIDGLSTPEMLLNALIHRNYMGAPTNDLSELVDKYKLVSNVGFGAGSFYELINGQ